MNKWFSAVFLLLISVSAWASGNVHSISAEAVTNHTDLSMGYLSQVFGNVGTVLQGTSGQMLGQMFYKFNEGVLIVAAIWLAYSTFTIVMRSAQEGSFMGANRNVALVFLRIALGLGLMFPNPSTGYSVFQDITMTVVVKGVELADETWSYALQYIDNGGTLWRQPSKTQISLLSKVGKTGANPNGDYPQVFNTIFVNEVCMVANSMMPQNSDNGTPTQTGISNSGTTNYTTYKPNFTATTVTFPGIDGSSACGSVDFSNIATNTTNNASNSDANSYQGNLDFARNAVSSAVTNLFPAAKQYACVNYAATGGHGDAPVCSGITGNYYDMSAGSQNFLSTLLAYTNNIYPLAQQQAGQASQNATGFIANAEKEGWMMAGRYYWDLSAIESFNQSVGQLGSYLPGTVQEGGFSHISDPNLKANAETASGNYASSALDLLQTYENTNNAGDTGQDNGTKGAAEETGINAGALIAGALMFGPLAIIIIPIILDTVALFVTFDTSGTPGGMTHDPILFMHNLGMHCIAIAGDIFIACGIGLAIIMVVTMFCQSMINLATPIKALVDWIKIPLMMVASAFLSIGVMLGYFVPMYPYLIFIFGVIGWIIAVIEAMVAAPLVCLGLTHPEGHDFLGEAKQALMLLLGVFLRPVLMIIGLIAGMILSYVSLRIVVYSFTGFLSDIFYVTSPSTGAASGNLFNAVGSAMGNYMLTSGGLTGIIYCLLLAPIFYVIFTSIVYIVTTQCFSLIYVLPDYILRWIGGPQTSSAINPAQMVGQVQGAVGQGGQQMGRATGDSVGSFGQSFNKKLGDLANNESGHQGELTDSNSSSSSGTGSTGSTPSAPSS